MLHAGQHAVTLSIFLSLFDLPFFVHFSLLADLQLILCTIAIVVATGVSITHTSPFSLDSSF
jgi:hypothetical protein